MLFGNKIHTVGKPHIWKENAFVDLVAELSV